MNTRKIDFRDPVVERFVDKIVGRSDVGFKKYGITLDSDPQELFVWLNHLQEELSDACLYLQKAKEVYTEDFMEAAFKPFDDISDDEKEV
jgi:hypothetical protein